MWSQFSVNSSMIIVKPIYFFLQQHRLINRYSIDRTKGKGIKLKELAKLCFLIFFYDKCILYSHSETSSKIQAWFVCHCHSFYKRCRHPFHTNLMRSFMHIQIRAYSMSCAMKIVHTVTPHSLTSQDIYLCTCCAFREFA